MRLSIIAGIICTAFAALTVACGGDDDKATSTPGASGAVSTTAAGGDDTGDATASEPSEVTATPEDGGDDDDYQAYFEDLAARFEFSREDSDAATADYDAALDAATTLDEQKQAINDFLETMIEVFDDSILTMNGFLVPSEAEGPHFTFRDDIVEARVISETLIDDLESADTVAEVEGVTNDFNDQVGILVDHAQAACRELQAIADEKDISEDLECKAA